MNDYLVAFLILTVYFSPVIYQAIIVFREGKEKRKIYLKNLYKILKITLLTLTPLIFIFFTLSHTNYLNYEKPISYSEIERITFKNFRGFEFFKKSLYGNKRFAYIVTTIDSKIKDHNVFVEANFHPSRSYVYDTEINSEELLTHELCHFKITELYARKARKEITKLNNFSKNRIESIISKNQIEEQNFQQKYDYDTFHSYVYKEQKKYEKLVDSLIFSLEKYKKPKIKFDEKN